MEVSSYLLQLDDGSRIKQFPTLTLSQTAQFSLSSVVALAVNSNVT